MTKQERNKDYYARNRERIREQQREYYSTNRDQIVAKKSEYQRRPEVKYRKKLWACGVAA